MTICSQEVVIKSLWDNYSTMQLLRFFFNDDFLQIRYKGKSLDLYKSKWMKENMASEASSLSPLTLTVSSLDSHTTSVLGSEHCKKWSLI